ncbi:MAG: hypothetical protein ACREJU_09200 [Nitrospiraceae bacterium]
MVAWREFLAPALTMLPAGHRIGVVQADAGFIVTSFLEALEARDLPYSIVARLTPLVRKLVVHRIAEADWWIGAGQQRTRAARWRGATPEWHDPCQPGGHTESLRRTYGEVAGEELGTAPVERSAVNVGTDRRLPPRACLARGEEGSRTADSRRSGRSLRSSRRTGKPATGRRETASWQRRDGRSEGRW